MRLTEAIDWLLTEHQFVMSDKGIKRGESHWYGPYRELTAVSGGESRYERFMSHLEHSIFGAKYHASTSRGGLDVYHIPVKDIEENADSDWFGLTEPRPKPLEGFHNMGDNLEVIAIPSVRYVYVEKGNTREQIRYELTSALDALIGKFGIKPLVDALNEKDGIEGHRFLDDQFAIKVTAKVHDYTKYVSSISAEELDRLLDE